MGVRLMGTHLLSPHKTFKAHPEHCSVHSVFVKSMLGEASGLGPPVKPPGLFFSSF